MRQGTDKQDNIAGASTVTFKVSKNKILYKVAKQSSCYTANPKLTKYKETWIERLSQNKGVQLFPFTLPVKMGLWLNCWHRDLGHVKLETHRKT